MSSQVDLYTAAGGVQGEVSVLGGWPGAKLESRRLSLPAGKSTITLTLAAEQTRNVRLWHPNGHGDQIR